MEPSQLGRLVEAHAAGLALYARQWCAAPEDVVQECVAYLEQHYGATVESRTIREEHVNFPLPKELRSLTVV